MLYRKKFPSLAATSPVRGSEPTLPPKLSGVIKVAGWSHLKNRAVAFRAAKIVRSMKIAIRPLDRDCIAVLTVRAIAF